MDRFNKLGQWVHLNAQGTHVITEGECKISGVPHSVKVKKEHYDAWRNGTMIAKAMPDVSGDDREFLISGITGKAFDALFQETLAPSNTRSSSPVVELDNADIEEIE